MTLLGKLKTWYPNTEITRLAVAGKMAEARQMAVDCGLWGLWIEIGEAAGLPCDATARRAAIANKYPNHPKFSCKS